MSEIEDFDHEQPATLERKPRRAGLVFLLLIIALVVGSGGAYAWFNFDRLMQASTSSRDAAAAPGSTQGDKDVLPDLLASQQKTSEDLEALKDSVAAQQQDLKSIADQLTALASRVDALQSAPPQAAAPAVVPSNARAQAAKPAKKPVRAPKTTGPISVGGAPLNTAPSAAPR